MLLVEVSGEKFAVLITLVQSFSPAQMCKLSQVAKYLKSNHPLCVILFNDILTDS